MGETKGPSGLRRVLFDRPVLKLFLVLLFIAVGSTLAQIISIRVFTLLVAVVTVIAVVYAIVLIGHIVSIYLIRRPIGRLLSAKDIASLLFSYVMLIAGILLVMTVLFIVVEELHLGYLTHGPTSDAFNKDVIDSGDPNLSHDYLYFSAVTFFTVGYGDISPMGLCKPLAIVTAFAGNIVTVVLMAIAVSVYLNRRTKPSDQATDVQSGRSPQN